MKYHYVRDLVPGHSDGGWTVFGAFSHRDEFPEHWDAIRSAGKEFEAVIGLLIGDHDGEFRSGLSDYLRDNLQLLFPLQTLRQNLRQFPLQG